MPNKLGGGEAKIGAAFSTYSAKDIGEVAKPYLINRSIESEKPERLCHARSGASCPPIRAARRQNEHRPYVSSMQHHYEGMVLWYGDMRARSVNVKVRNHHDISDSS